VRGCESARCATLPVVHSLIRPLVALALAVALISGAAAQTADPFIGTWKLVPEKSKYESGQPPQNFTRTYEDRGGGVIFMTVESVNAQGATRRSYVAYKRDGKPYPEGVAGDTAVRMSATKSIDPYTEEVEFFVDGVRAVTGTTDTTIVISKDGRTMTQQLRTTAQDGRRITNVAVYEKQAPR
jgi:hypothetical protein